MTWRSTVIVGFFVILLAAVALWRLSERIAHDPDFAFLPISTGANWIRSDERTLLRIRPLGDHQTAFRVNFSVESLPTNAVLHLVAMKRAEVFLNSVPLTGSVPETHNWKQPVFINLDAHVQPGVNQLIVLVSNTNGPRLISAHSNVLGLTTGPTWETLEPGGDWHPAILADTIPPTELSNRFAPSQRAILDVLPWLFIVVALTITSLVQTRHNPVRSSHARLVFILAAIAMAANNIIKLKYETGFDIDGHINYIHSVYVSGRLPLPNEGWQTFQPPLYYLLSLPFYAFFTQFGDIEAIIRALRWIPLACGIAQIEIAYRTAVTLWPTRNNIQIVATALGGFFPINLYISQYIGNEPLAGLLSASAILIAMRMLANRDSVTSGTPVALGICVGLAILTKVTALLLLGPMIAVVAYTDRRRNLRSLAKSLGSFAAPILAICGWYFLWTYLALGQPFYGGWDPNRGIVWWQDPGYRSASQFLRFGEALVRPIHAGTQGVWDALYSTLWLDGWLSGTAMFEHRPMWNYSWMTAGAWLGLVPSALILTGAVTTGFDEDPVRRRLRIFAMVCIAVYWGAFMLLFLNLPVYSTGKATYTLGVLPCYAVLGAAGFEYFSRNRATSALLCVALTCWATAAYLSYFVL